MYSRLSQDCHPWDLPLPAFTPRRYRPANRGAWSGHLGFANDLIAALRPALIVELGTHYGESYFGFCQSVFENQLDCLCYAIDHWRGEQHAGFYGEDVFEEVQRYNDTHYRTFSYLLRNSFDDAVKQFADESIDLLHIDGFHTYEVSKHDFDTWLPKVKPGGIILLHDVVVRHEDFGVWRLWEELTNGYTETFAFHHWWGLGVVRKPGNRLVLPCLLDVMFNAPPPAQERIRQQYEMYALYLESTLGREEEKPATATVTNQVAQVQVFPGHGGEYAESSSATQTVEFGRWSTLVFEFPEGIGTEPLRIDLADLPCTIELGEISITHQRTGGLLWAARHAPELRALMLHGTVVLLPEERECLLFSYGDDPQIQLPSLEQEHEAIRVEISLRLDRTFEAVREALNAQTQKQKEAVQTVSRLESEISILRGSAEEAGQRASRLESEMSALQRSMESELSLRDSLESQLIAVKTELEELIASSRLAEAEEAVQRASRLEAEMSALQRSMESEVSLRGSLESQLRALKTELEAEHATRMAMQQSRSWRITAPVRVLMNAMRSKS